MPTRAITSCMVAVLLVGGTACDREPALQRLSEARRLSAELLVQFTQAADAANRAVMTNTDEASIAFAREAGEATEAVQRDTESLKPLLVSLSYSEETRLLEEFAGRFTEYRALDHRILELAVENTNIKAQHVSFGPAQASADAFRDAVESAARSASAQDLWHARALAATAALVALMTAFYREAGFGLPQQAATRAFGALFADPRLGRVWIVEKDKVPVGYVVLTLGFSMEFGGVRGFVDDFFVSPSARDKGLGAAMLAEVQRTCRELGVCALLVETGPEDHPARSLYARAGFQESGRVFLTQALAPALHDAHEP